MLVRPSPSTGPLLLLVDDHADSGEMYAEYLRFHGYEVIIGADAQECVNLARARHPALIVLDIWMAPMTGTDTVRTLRQDALLSDIRIIALTAYAPPQQREKAIVDGFDAVLEKPCLPDGLKLVIDKLVASPR